MQIVKNTVHKIRFAITILPRLACHICIEHFISDKQLPISILTAEHFKRYYIDDISFLNSEIEKIK